jgi:hypothetical protein
MRRAHKKFSKINNLVAIQKMEKIVQNSGQMRYTNSPKAKGA